MLRCCCHALWIAMVFTAACTATPAVEAIPEDDAATEDDAQTSDSLVDGARLPADASETACHTSGCVCQVDSDCKSKHCQSGGNATKFCVSCVPTSPPTEVCDGSDNDCDGQTDETTCIGDNTCLLGVCAGASGKCNQVPQTGIWCDDSNACTSGEQCAAGKCQGSAIVCDDNNVCTSDSCNSQSGCVFKAAALLEGAICTDDDLCTLNDTCVEGTCAGQSAKNCQDGSVCTDDVCNPSSGSCTSTNNTASCDDGDGCTQGDQCSGGLCFAGKVSCDDGNPCTLDSCDTLAKLCKHEEKAHFLPPTCAACKPEFSGVNCDSCSDSDKSLPTCL